MSVPSQPGVKLIAIVAMASNRVIGRDGTLPWHLPEDLKFFKKTTSGHAVLMGRKTYDSILQALGKPLPNRRNLVVSRQLTPLPGVEVLRDPEELAQLPGLTSPVYLIGGAHLYETLLPCCDEILLTYILAAHEGDTRFPVFEDEFVLAEVLGGGEGFEFRRYIRANASR